MEITPAESDNGGQQEQLQLPNHEQGQRRRMLDEEIDRYDTYEEYLDSLVSDEDHFYLEDVEMARVIAELGYRSSGDTLSRENFHKMKSRLAEKRMLTMASSGQASMPVSPMHNKNNSLQELESSAAPMTLEMKSRAKDIYNGDLSTVVFMRTKVAKKSKMGNSNLMFNPFDCPKIEVSGHIDLGHRQATEHIVPYLTGEKRLVPKLGDLTFYNWSGTGKADFQSSTYFEVQIKGSRKLYLRHRLSGLLLDISSVREDEGQGQRAQVGNFSFICSGWKRTEYGDENETYIYLCDIRKTSSL